MTFARIITTYYYRPCPMSCYDMHIACVQYFSISTCHSVVSMTNLFWSVVTDIVPDIVKVRWNCAKS